jgi:hypothetical protein
MKPKTTAFLAAVGLALANSASAAVLFADDFTVTGTTDTFDLNYNNAGRQSGSQALQTWTGAGNARLGLTDVFGGDGNYLTIADNGSSARLTGLSLSSGLVGANEKLVIQFKADSIVDWMSFMISPSSGTGVFHPVVGSGDFGMLIRPGGEVQAFNNNGIVGGINDWSLGNSGINTITLTFSGANGTGSPFAGNGTKVNIANGTISWDATLDTGFTTETISFGSYAGARGYVDNLSIYTIPEPSAALLGSLGLLALLRRRR